MLLLRRVLEFLGLCYKPKPVEAQALPVTSLAAEPPKVMRVKEPDFGRLPVADLYSHAARYLDTTADELRGLTYREFDKLTGGSNCVLYYRILWDKLHRETVPCHVCGACVDNPATVHQDCEARENEQQRIWQRDHASRHWMHSRGRIRREHRPDVN